MLLVVVLLLLLLLLLLMVVVLARVVLMVVVLARVVLTLLLLLVAVVLARVVLMLGRVLGEGRRGGGVRVGVWGWKRGEEVGRGRGCLFEGAWEEGMLWLRRKECPLQGVVIETCLRSACLQEPMNVMKGEV